MACQDIQNINAGSSHAREIGSIRASFSLLIFPLRVSVDPTDQSQLVLLKADTFALFAKANTYFFMY